MFRTFLNHIKENKFSFSLTVMLNQNRTNYPTIPKLTTIPARKLTDGSETNDDVSTKVDIKGLGKGRATGIKG